MELHLIYAENFKLDGGACFGVVPKAIWEKLCTVDENNMVNIALRNLLVVDGDRIILFDTGIGKKQSDKFLSHYFLFGDTSLEKSFLQAGYAFEDVTDVVFTHLHFDHCGGAVKFNDDKSGYEPVFKNATYWVSKSQWENAIHPNPREKASYLPENYMPLLEKGILKFIENEQFMTPDVFLKMVNGHTPGQLFPIINYKGNKVVFGADFIATSANIPLAFIPSFDTQPLLSMQEKTEFLQEAVDHNYILIFQHDYYVECATIQKTEKGNYKEKEILKLKDI
ncbi:MAG: MBL fold metallo-hydrolase [Bacteroidales bacterium]|nr:MBL fold metallo-hydrolase [Bacteroidales bacterium]